MRHTNTLPHLGDLSITGSASDSVPLYFYFLFPPPSGYAWLVAYNYKKCSYLSDDMPGVYDPLLTNSE